MWTRCVVLRPVSAPRGRPTVTPCLQMHLADGCFAAASKSGVEIVVSTDGTLLIFLRSGTYSTKFRFHVVKYTVSGRLFTSLPDQDIGSGGGY